MTWPRVTWPHGGVASHDLAPSDVASHDVASRDIASCDVASRDLTSHCVASYVLVRSRRNAWSFADAGSTEGVSEFLLEATIMQDFSHANVLSLLAVVIDDVTPYVIMPLMENGDLRALVSNHSLVSRHERAGT